MARAAAVVILAVGLAAAAPKPKDALRTPAYQPTTVGARWVYEDNGRESVEEVVAADARDGATVLTIRRKTADGEYTRVLAVAAGGVYDRGVRQFTFDPVCLLKLPAKPGQTWDVALAAQPGLRGYEGKMTVGTAERVEVPAGTFEAVPVRLELTAENGVRLAEPKVHTRWWAPDVGVVRFQAEHTDRKLKSFTPGKK